MPGSLRITKGFEGRPGDVPRRGDDLSPSGAKPATNVMEMKAFQQRYLERWQVWIPAHA